MANEVDGSATVVSIQPVTFKLPQRDCFTVCEPLGRSSMSRCSLENSKQGISKNLRTEVPKFGDGVFGALSRGLRGGGVCPLEDWGALEVGEPHQSLGHIVDVVLAHEVLIGGINDLLGSAVVVHGQL
eukprot:5064933-Pyramimonas_sp.AAC.1